MKPVKDEGYRNAAIIWLSAKGIILSEGEDAIQTAELRAYEEECNRRIKHLDDSGEYVDFYGMNCDETEDNFCLGWDGKSRRCDCGNRRVYWAKSEDFTFENPTIYAIAW